MGTRSRTSHKHGRDILSQVGPRPACFNPRKVKYWSLEKATAAAERWKQRAYICGNHWHLTHHHDWKPRVH